MPPSNTTTSSSATISTIVSYPNHRPATRSHRCSLSLFCRPVSSFFLLCHYDLNSSSNNNHPFQRLSSLPAAVEASTLSSATPTVSNPSTDHDSSSTWNASSSNSSGSTLHRCHHLHHVVLLGHTTFTPGSLLPFLLLLLLLHDLCSQREQ